MGLGALHQHPAGGRQYLHLRDLEARVLGVHPFTLRLHLSRGAQDRRIEANFFWPPKRQPPPRSETSHPPFFTGLLWAFGKENQFSEGWWYKSNRIFYKGKYPVEALVDGEHAGFSVKVGGIPSLLGF